MKSRQTVVGEVRTSPSRRRDRSAPSSKRVLLVEDHPLMRSAISALLESALGVVDTVVAETGKQALERLGAKPWDLILLDHNLPDAKGVDLLPKIADHGPVVVLTSFESPHLAGIAREYGARGYVSKGDDPDRIVSVIESVLAGDESFPILLADSPPAFSPQERRVLAGLVQGRSAVEIAKELDVRPQTVQSYKDRLCSKLGSGNVADLVRIAVSKGLG